MKPINQFNKNICKVLSDEALKALQTIADKHGLTVNRGKGTFNDLSFSMKINFEAKAVDGKTHEQVEFENYAPFYDLKASDFGKKFTAPGDPKKEEYEICGIKKQSRVRPIICKTQDGRRFKFPADFIKMILQSK